MGDAISDGFFGNEPNLLGPACCDTGPAEQNQIDPGSVAGTVLGSSSPGSGDDRRQLRPPRRLRGQ
jgi:hypothetical protein